MKITSATNDNIHSFSKEDEDALLKKIKIALEQVKSGDFLSEEELDEEIKKWGNESE